MSLNVRGDFPALNQKVMGKPLTYLDSAATTLKPQVVVDRLNKYHQLETANVHRGAHYLSDIGTQAFEGARQTVQMFINAKSANEIVFTYGTTDGLNLLATSLGQKIDLEGKNIVLSEMEHHSNLVPWHLLAERTGVELRAIPVNEDGHLDLSGLDKLIDENTAIVSIVHMSNTLGTINNIETIINRAQAVGAVSIIDAAQSISAMPIDVQKLNCDYLVFSGHKLFGPYGVGILYGKEFHLNFLPPYRGGGAMIEKVEIDNSTYLDAPQRFEAGTPNIPAVIGLATAIDYVAKLGFDKIQAHESEILNEARKKLSDIEGITIYSPVKNSMNVISFNCDWAHAADLGEILNQQGVAIRVGHHCTQPLLNRLGVTSVARASFSIYSSLDDVEQLYQGLKKCKELLS